MSVWNGHYACTCYHLLFVFNQFGDLERSALRPGQRSQCRGLGRCAQAGRCTLGAKVVSHGCYVALQMAEAAIARQMLQEILRLIAELRPQPPPAPA
jgi:hypothetical protein